MTFIPNIEWELGMELALNLGWVLVTVWMFCAWLRTGPRGISKRRTQFIALAVVILILLPAISLTDDLLAAQNPAELDSTTCAVRRDYGGTSPHSIVPAGTALPIPGFAELSIAFVRLAAPRGLRSPLIYSPALASIQNRPPPAA